VGGALVTNLRSLSNYPIYRAPAFPLRMPESRETQRNDPRRLQVLKSGDLVFIRSPFCSSLDLLVTSGLGVNHQISFLQAHLVLRSAKMEPGQIAEGVLIHKTSDDSTPWHLNGTYIGGNHGCADAIEIRCPDHGLELSDTGGEWMDEAGRSFHVLRVPDCDTVQVLSDNSGEGTIWKFCPEISGARLRRLSGSGPAALAIESQKRIQIIPSLRVLRQEFLADGVLPLRAGEPVECSFLDLLEDQELVNPGDVLQSVLRRPGTKPDFLAEGLGSVLRNRIVYRFRPDGSTMVETNSEALQDFEMGHMGFVQAAPLVLGEFDTHEYLVPGTVPFEAGGISFDFGSMQDFTPALPQRVDFSADSGNLQNPKNPPHRFLQFLGNIEDGSVRRKIGFVIGYSPVEGITTPGLRSRCVETAAVISQKKKTYPRALDQKLCKKVSAGEAFHCLAYRQYFNPTAVSQSASCHWHHHGDGMLVFADFLEPVASGCLRLPPFFAGRRFGILEQSPNVSLEETVRIPPAGLRFSSQAKSGFLVLSVQAE